MRDPRIHGIPEPADWGSGNPDPVAPESTGSDPDALVPDPGAPSGEPDAADCDGDEQEPETVELDIAALLAKAEMADEYLDLAKRTRAEFENYRKRAVREAKAAQERGALKLALDLLPAIDNLDRALAHAAGSEENGDGSLIAGIKHVHSDLIAALRRAEIEPYSPEGEAFDPQYHEAVAQQPFEGTVPGTVVEVYQRGYRRGETVLRPARVVVAG